MNATQKQTTPTLADFRTAAQNAGLSDIGATGGSLRIALTAPEDDVDLTDRDAVETALYYHGFTDEQINAIVTNVYTGDQVVVYPGIHEAMAGGHDITIDDDTYKWVNDRSTPHSSGGYYRTPDGDTLFSQYLPRKIRRADEYTVHGLSDDYLTEKP